ncbi:hypothetical protein GCM10010260_81470 [Streptomyces filipinensis]|uniref:Uncharacterized protein n=1 Tax=Streptomyces filipinensis TaxID=66887 RepID=A0A918IK48_9ACTN|nr:hypothetical protein [Streptomyces filipinensis]GGV28665.1 hypothetical protein GCM10010260_81470 [Streptomyces filipinensis]
MNLRTTLSRLGRGIAAGAEMTLLTSVTASSVHTAQPVNASTAGATQFVNAASLPADQLRDLNHPVPYTEYARSHESSTTSLKAAGQQPDTATETCASSAPGKQHGPRR